MLDRFKHGWRTRRVAAICGIVTLVLPALLLPCSAAGASAPTGTYSLTAVSLPNFNPMTVYLYNYRTQYPTVAYGSTCPNGIVYIDNSSKLDCYTPANSTAYHITPSALTLLYQQSVGIQAQVDNEFFIEDGYNLALLFGTTVSLTGNTVVEVVFLNNGTIKQATTPVVFGNTAQADYVGSGNVAVFNGTGNAGSPTYLTNVFNGTSWRAGPSVGFAPNNIYFVPSMGAFIDTAGTRVIEYEMTNHNLSMMTGPSLWFNRTGLTSVSAVSGIVYDNATARLFVQLATNLGPYIEQIQVSGSTIVRGGSTAYLSTCSMFGQRYVYTSGFVWCLVSGRTTLVNFATNASVSVNENVVSRDDSSGANGNFELSNPLSTADYLSLNGSLLGLHMPYSEYLWATTTTAAPIGAGGLLALGGVALATVAVLAGAGGSAGYAVHRARKGRSPSRMKA